MGDFLHIPDTRLDFKNDIADSDLAGAALGNRQVAFKSFVFSIALPNRAYSTLLNYRR